MEKRSTTFTRGLVSCVLALAVVIGTLIVPLSLCASAYYDSENDVTVFDFDLKKGTRGCLDIGFGTDIICGGDSFNIKEVEGSDALISWNPTWDRAFNMYGGFRLNDSEGAYTLKAGRVYSVSLRIKVTSPIKRTGAKSATIDDLAYNAYSLGYGITLKGDGVGGLKKKMFTLATYGVDSEYFTADTMNGAASFPIGGDSAWQTLSYVFTAPDDAEGEDLGLYSYNYYGGTCWIDDVTVKDCGTDVGYVIAADTVSGRYEIYTGKVGEKAEIKALADLPERPFLGWYNEDRSEQYTEIKYEAGGRTVYGFFDGNAVITCKYLDKTAEVSGAKDETVVLPEVPETDGTKKFIGWYKDNGFSEKYTGGTYGVSNFTLYALYSDKVTITLKDVYLPKTYTVAGYPEEKIDFPVPTDTKHDITSDDYRVFNGWYLDGDGKQKYESGVFPVNSGLILYGKWDKKADDIITDFENYKYKNERTFGKGISIEAGVGADGSKGLKYDSAADEDRAFFKIADFSGVQGKLYKFSYKYRIEKADTDFMMYFYASDSPGNFYQNCTDMPEYDVKFSKDDAGKGWIESESVFFVPDTYLKGSTAYNLVSAYFYPTAYATEGAVKGNIEMYFDDIRFTACSPAQSLITLYTMDLSSRCIEDLNYIGENIAFPTDMDNGDRAFLGWATDTAGTNMYTETVHTGENLTLYAIWDYSNDPLTIDFEEYSTGNKYMFNPVLLKVTDEFRYRGRKAVKLSYTEETKAAGAANETPANCMHLAVVEDKTTYKVTFRYYAEKSEGGVAVKLATSTGNIWDPAHNWEYPGAYTIKKGTAPGWNKGELYLTTAFNESGAGVGNTLYAIFTMSPDGDDVVYFDDFTIEPIDPSTLGIIYFDDQNGGGAVAAGAVGSAITFPDNPTAFGKEFDFWAYDAEGSRPFTDKTFTAGETILYAIFSPAKEVLFTYEDYTYSAKYATCNASVQNVNGNNVVVVDRDPTHEASGKLNGAGAFWGAANSKVYVVDARYNYVIKFKYYIAKRPEAIAKFAAAVANSTNFWDAGVAGSESEAFFIESTETMNEWHTGYYALDFGFSDSKCPVAYRGLYFNIKGGDNGLFYFDDITIIRVDNGKAGIAVKANGSNTIPGYVMQKPGASYQSLLPSAPTRSGYKFVNYLFGSMKVEDWAAPEFGHNISARWVEMNVKQNFDDTYKQTLALRKDYGSIDFDYELYDSQKEGNSKDNVTSGRYSLHRKGNSMFFENACILEAGRMSDTDRYTVTMRVKMDSYKHTDGAVKIASNNSYVYPWCTTGDYYAIAPIADLTDGEWHTVSYTFNSVAPYLTLQTPGYCSIYIDDVDIRLVDKETTPLSEVPNYTEYVVQKRDESGNVIATGDTIEFDVNDIIDASLKPVSADKSGKFPWLYVGIASAAAVSAGGLIVLLAAKKRKKEDK